MLEIRPNCEHCGKDLPPNSTEAMICSFECTYCKECALELFEDVCPSCGGNFVPRPIRPSKMIVKYLVSKEKTYAPKDLDKARILIEKYKNIKPENR